MSSQIHFEYSIIWKAFFKAAHCLELIYTFMNWYMCIRLYTHRQSELSYCARHWTSMQLHWTTLYIYEKGLETSDTSSKSPHQKWTCKLWLHNFRCMNFYHRMIWVQKLMFSINRVQWLKIKTFSQILSLKIEFEKPVDQKNNTWNTSATKMHCKNRQVES